MHLKDKVTIVTGAAAGPAAFSHGCATEGKAFVKFVPRAVHVEMSKLGLEEKIHLCAASPFFRQM